MPATILVRTADNPVPDAPGKWYGGQCVIATDGDHTFGYQEMPVNYKGAASPFIINSVDPANLTPYVAATTTSSGRLILGTKVVQVSQGDMVVWQLPIGAAPEFGVFVNYGSQETYPNGFQHFRILDLTKEQAQAFVQPVNDNTDPENPVLISRSKYKVNQAGMDALAASDGWLEGAWSDFDQYFEDQYP